VTAPDAQTLSGRHVEAFVDARGARLLDLLNEPPAGGAAWASYSHGAFIRVRSPHPALFDRLVVVLVRPAEQGADEFRRWAEQRLVQLDRYMQAANTGKVVRTVPRDRCVVGVVMRRVGRDPGDPRAELPPLDEIPRVLARFAREVERYVRVMGDDGLRYVRALRLHAVPRRARSPAHVLGLDALQTVLGLREPPLALAPATLVRGIVGEMAQLVRGRGDELRMERTPFRPLRSLRRAHRRHRHEALAAALDEVGARIEGQGADPPTAARWLEAVRIPRLTPPVRALLGLLALGALGAATWFVFSA
jgi:hypothetical protein